MSDATIFWAGMLAGCAMANVARALGGWTGRRLARLLSRRKLAAPVQAEPVEPQRPSSRWQWRAMPCGTRIELGDTGYWVELVAKKGRQPYLGYDPEGDGIISGFNLQEIKSVLEQQAEYRTEFAPEPAVWRRS